MRNVKFFHSKVVLTIFQIVVYGNSFCKELEPRALANIPIGMSFAVIGYGYAHGNILFDPALPLEETGANLHTIVGAFVRSINLFGLSGKMDVFIPYGIGEWTGNYTGIDTATSRSGVGDVRFRLSFNFLGAPALKCAEFRDYNPGTISGFSIQVYDPNKIINLGSNRWVLRPQWGLPANYQKWIWETYLSAWIFTTKSEFLRENEVIQKPLYAIKFHGIRKFTNYSRLALDGGYGIGGQSNVNDELRNNPISTIRLGMTYAIPIGRCQTFRFTGITGIRLEKGADFDALAISYQYRWIKETKQN